MAKTTQQLKQIESLFSPLSSEQQQHQQYPSPKSEVTFIESSVDSDCNVHGGKRDSIDFSTSIKNYPKRNSIISLSTLNNNNNYGNDNVNFCGSTQLNNGVSKRESIDREMNTAARRGSVVQRRRSFAGDRASSADNIR